MSGEEALAEAIELERATDWRIRKLGENPADRQSAAAAKLLQKLADDVRRLRGSPAYTEYLTILRIFGAHPHDEFFGRSPVG